VGREHHGFPLAPELEDEVPHLATPDGIEAGHGFVEDEKLGVMNDGLGQAHSLQHPLGKLAKPELLAGVQSDPLQRPRDQRPSSSPGNPGQGSTGIEKLGGGEVVIEIGILGQEPHPPPGRDRSQLLPQERAFPSARLHEPEQDLGWWTSRPVQAEEP
jgi:hypothetical protein